MNQRLTPLWGEYIRKATGMNKTIIMSSKNIPKTAYFIKPFLDNTAT
ncbi:hypothetical protein E2C01_036863 [Portunus trituberculatus]|uniref:Uncharacterized protein n=1 Tax=Portunus trituberculatus TaxID=210409 RepID=A0A5B7FDL8_PORTR|nr:hypothetical protein [Portunus trituberculatus]